MVSGRLTCEDIMKAMGALILKAQADITSEAVAARVERMIRGVLLK
jgi:hypothetical protein